MDTQGTRESKDAVSGVGAFAHTGWGLEAPASRPRRVLVVDDNRDVLCVMSKILSMLGYDVVSASDGNEGLALHLEDPCQVVLTDLEMPAMDGLTLARRIKAEYPLIPVVLMTGNALPGRDVSLAAGESFIDEILYKPVHLDELQKALQRLLP